MKKAIKYTILFFNILAGLSLLGAFLAPMVNPEQVPFLPFWGLIMPYSLIINVAFIIFWVLKTKFYFIISLLAIALSWNTAKTSFSYHSTDTTEHQEDIKVLSYNVRVFDRYNWSKNDNTVNDMLRLVKAEKADIICLQEFGTSKKPEDGVTERYILNALGEYRYHYIQYSQRSLTKKHQQGLAILSKYPIISHNTISNENAHRTNTIYTDIKTNSGKIRVMNSHFESIHFNSKYDIIEGIDGNNYKTRIRGAIRSINKASISHSKSAKEIGQYIKASPFPVILCTDMNNTPVSNSYHTLTKNVEDAYLHQGSGFGATYNGAYPFLRIDYIFHTSDLHLVRYKRIRKRYSDHYPITASFATEL